MNILRPNILSWRNILIRYFKSHPYRFISISLSLILTILGTYFLILEGFLFLDSLGGLGTVILRRIFYILFFILFFMLGMSSSVVFYALSFKNRETEFFLSLPLRIEEIFKKKFIQTSFIASWVPFLVLCLFILIYCKINNLSIIYTFLFIFYLLPFLFISIWVGVISSLVLLRFLSLKSIFLFFLSFFLFILFFFFFFKPTSPEASSYFLSQEFALFKLSRVWFLPFYWIAEGFTKLEESQFFSSFIFLMNLWSLSFLLLRSLGFLGRKFFREAYFKHQVPPSKKEIPKNILDFMIEKLPLPSYFKLFILKDIKTFLREPREYLQILVFFGILFFYFLNLRHFSYHLLGSLWKYLILTLNTFGILCISSALTVRFIFPQWSREIKLFWLIKRSPISLTKIFIAKLIFFSSFFVLLALGLILISNIMLEVKGELFYLSLVLVIIGSFTFSCISLALGAYFSDFRRPYLAALESLGGFLNLVVNLSYLALALIGFFGIIYFNLIGKLNINIKVFLYLGLSVWTIFSIGLCFFICFIGLERLKEKESF